MPQTFQLNKMHQIIESRITFVYSQIKLFISKLILTSLTNPNLNNLLNPRQARFSRLLFIRR